MEKLSPEKLREMLKDMTQLPSIKDVQSAFMYKEEEYGVPNKAWDKFRQTRTQEGRNIFYEFLTAEYVDAFCTYLQGLPEELGIKGRSLSILEVGAGSARLAHFVRKGLPSDGFSYHATDSGKFGLKPLYPDEVVEQLESDEAVEKYRPDLVIASWMTNISDWTEGFRKCPSVREYILIGDPGVCGNQWYTYGWGTRTNPEAVPYVADGFSMQELSHLSRMQICITDDSVFEDKRSRTIRFRRESGIL